MSKTRDELLEEFINNSKAVHHVWKAKFYEALAQDLSPALVGILLLLDKRQPVTGSDIAVEMHISRSAVTQMIEALEDKGYICRQDNLSDRRSVQFSLTSQGQEKLLELHAVKRKLFRKITTSLSESELESMIHIHHKLLRELEN